MADRGLRFFLGSDHGGVALRDLVAAQLREQGHEIVGVEGPATPDEKADYPDVAALVARQVAAAPGSLGVLVCGTGQGMAISANKIPGVRAGVVADVFSARMIRAHNDANVLCLGERVLGVELAKLLVEAFVSTPFEGGRHARRVDKMRALDASGEDRD